MVNKENVHAFVEYNYITFSRSQCVKRIIFFWGGTTVAGVISSSFRYVFLISNIILTLIFLVLIFKYPLEKYSRFLSDGCFYLYTALILNITSYKVLIINKGSNILLFIFFMFLLCGTIVCTAFRVINHIQKGNYRSKNTGGVSVVLALGGGIIGQIVARILLGAHQTNGAIIILSLSLLILSLFLSIGGLNLLKVYFLLKYPNSECMK